MNVLLFKYVYFTLFSTRAEAIKQFDIICLKRIVFENAYMVNYRSSFSHCVVHCNLYGAVAGKKRKVLWRYARTSCAQTARRTDL